MGSFEASTAAGPERCVVTLAGNCDLAARQDLTAALLDAVEASRLVFVDVARVDFFDSTGVHALVTAYHAAEREGGRLYVVNAGGSVAMLLELTGLDTLLQAPEWERGRD